MARRRFFVPEVTDGEAVLSGDDAHRLARVLRVEPGQQFEISDGSRLYLAAVSTVSKSSVAFEVVENLPLPAALPQITLYASLIKFDRFEWMVEKATEIGVARIVPVEAARSDQGLLAAAAKRVQRWRVIARESAQQCRRVAPPLVDDARKLSGLTVEEYKLRLEEEPGAPLLLKTLPASLQPVSILIGPEGGWTESERSRLDAASWLPVSLGASVLRAETASILAVGLASQWWWSGIPQ